jgi:hypothetical protein
VNPRLSVRQSTEQQAGERGNAHHQDAPQIATAALGAMPLSGCHGGSQAAGTPVAQGSTAPAAVSATAPDGTLLGQADEPAKLRNSDLVGYAR